MKGCRGSATVEMVVIAPLLVALFAFVLGCGRWVQAGMTVRNAADQAARSASLVSAGRMRDVGLAQARQHLSSRTAGCAWASAEISVHHVGRTSFVRAVARCTVDFRGLMGVFGLPRSVTATSTEVIDVFTFR